MFIRRLGEGDILDEGELPDCGKQSVTVSGDHRYVLSTKSTQGKSVVLYDYDLKSTPLVPKETRTLFSDNLSSSFMGRSNYLVG